VNNVKLDSTLLTAKMRSPSRSDVTETAPPATIYTDKNTWGPKKTNRTTGSKYTGAGWPQKSLAHSELSPINRTETNKWDGTFYVQFERQ